MRLSRLLRGRPLAFFGLSVGSACGGSTLLTPAGPASPDAGADVAAEPSTAFEAGAAEFDAGVDGDAGIFVSTTPEDAAPDSAPDACTDTQNDPLNCGTCGHDCQGAACVAGTCGSAPRVLASGQAPTFIAVDAENVYWINHLPQPAGSAGHSQVMRCAIRGCNDEPTVLADGLYTVGGIAVEQGAVWWPTGPVAINDSTEAPNVMSCAVGGCSDAPTSHLSSRGVFYAFAANEASWFVADVDAVLTTCPLAGCGTSPVTVYTDDYEVLSMALNATGVYWANGAGNVLSCPLAGCGDAAAAVASSFGGYSNLLAADDGHLYWLASGTAIGGGKLGPVRQWLDGGVYESPLPGGGDAGPTALASYASWLAGAALTIDGTDVYWSTEDGSGRYGQIVRCSIGGCGGNPTPIAGTSSELPSAGVAVDATNVYWSDPGRGAVMIAPK